MSNYQPFAEIRKFISFLEKLTELEVKELQEGKLQITFQLEAVAPKVKGFKSNAIDIEDAIQNLNSFSTREEATEFLHSLQAGHDTLYNLARALDLHANKKNNIQQLEQMIIEGTVGYRLRSQAIRPQNEGIKE